MLRIWISLFFFANIGLIGPSAYGQDHDGPMGPKDPDIWILSVLEELQTPGLTVPPQGGSFTVHRHTGIPPARGDKPKGAFVDEKGIYYLGQIKRGRRRERILSSATGPGVLTRIWLSDQSGHLRIYCDGAAEPVLDMATDAIFGHHMRFFTEPLCVRHGSSAVLSLPVPYKESIQVTVDGPSIRYAVQHRQYPKGVDLETFTSTRCVEAIYRAGGLFRLLNKTMASPPKLTAKPGQALIIPRPSFDAVVPGNKTVVAFEQNVTSPTVLETMTLDAIPPFKIVEQLHRCSLVISQDGQELFDLPLHHVFGINSQLETGVTLAALGYEASRKRLQRWIFRMPIPFAKNVTVRIRNDSARKATGLRLSFSTRAATKQECEWRLIGRHKRAFAESKDISLAFPEGAVLVREVLEGTSREALSSCSIDVSGFGRPKLREAPLATHFALPTANPGSFGSSLWGSWSFGWSGKFLVTRCRALDRVPVSGLIWRVNRPQKLNLTGFSASLFYYQPAEKRGALSGGKGR